MTSDVRIMLRVLATAVFTVAAAAAAVSLLLWLFPGKARAQDTCMHYGEVVCRCCDGSRPSACVDCTRTEEAHISVCETLCDDFGGHCGPILGQCDARPDPPNSEAGCWDGDPNNDLLTVICLADGSFHQTCASHRTLFEFIETRCGDRRVESFDVAVNSCFPEVGPFVRPEFCGDDSDCGGNELCTPTPGQPAKTCQPPEEAAKCATGAELRVVGDADLDGKVRINDPLCSLRVNIDLPCEPAVRP